MQSKTYFSDSRKWAKSFMWSFPLMFILLSNSLAASDPANFWWAVDAGPDQNICLGQSAQLEATGASDYVWSPATGLSCTACPNPVASPMVTTTYFVSAGDGTTDSVTVHVFTNPQIISATGGDPTDCNLPNGTILVEAQGSGPLEYSVDGGAIWQDNGVFTALSSGNYSVMVRHVGGACPVQGPSLTLQAPDAPQILNVSPTDPTFCDTPNGAIIISGAGGMAPLEYSIDGGMNWQSSNTFQLLSAGQYSAMARNADGSCEVAWNDIIVLHGSPDEPDISGILSFGPSSCTASEGIITIVLSNDNGSFEFSIDGGTTFQAANNFSNLTEGLYEIIVRRNDGTCAVHGGFVNLLSSVHPAFLGTSVIHPTGCGTADGHITVLAFGPAALEYSINGGGSWQASNLFPGLQQGDYQVMVRNSDGSCVTPGETVTLTGPVPPVINSVAATNPTACGFSDGTIVVNATGTGALEYTIDGATWSPAGIFTDLPDGSYTIGVREVVNGCTTFYTNNPVLLAAPGNGPVINDINIGHPMVCGAQDGTISIDASGAGMLQYSIDNGTTFQSSNAFIGLGAGSYNIVVSLMGGTCTASATVDLIPVQSCTDTVFVNIPADATTTLCLDPSVFDFQGLFTSVGFCGQGNAATVLATSIAGECLTLVPATGFTGISPDLLCTVHCFNNSMAQCDTTYLRVTVNTTADCDPVFAVDTVVVPYSENPTLYCVPIPLTTISNYNILLDGAPYDNPFICDLDQSVAYSYGFLPGGGNSGPYTLDFWMINGTMHNGAFNNPQELTALMNSIDPNGFWQINPQGSIIFGGDPNTQYGNMQITQVASGIPTVLMTNFTFQPQGFTVSMANPGIHLLVVQDPVTGCSDTLVLNVPFPQPDPETVVLNTTVNTPTAPYCLNGANLPGGVISSIGFCGNPQNGGAPIVSDTCVFYVPNLNFAGQDDFCVVVCDNGFPQVCDTTFFIVNVAPEQDTVYLEIPVGETSVDTCLSSFIIELPGPIDQASFCGINPNQLTGNITANCLEFNTLNNFSGISEVCVEFCSGGFCDLTIVVVNVVPPIVCDEVFLENVITIPSPEAEGFLCIPVAPGNIVNFEVTLDGGPPFTAFAPCNFADQLFYNYNILPPGPYLLESWTVNGTTFMGNFPDINTLIDSMNVWDPMGNWTNNPFGLTINGGVPGSLYGNLVISESQGSVFTISPDAVVLPLGSNMPVNGYGNHQLIMTELNGCADTVTVVLQQYLVNSQTLFFETNLNTSVVPICANTSELLGELQTFNFCELPANGSVTVIGDTCVSYTPNLNFTGVDNFCLLVCDDYQPAVCDTFFVVVNTQLPTDTVYVDADDVVPFEVCLDSTALQLPGSINAAFVCEADAAVVALELSGNCITIDLEDSFVGTTTACVVYCTADVPPICDTTWLIIEFDGVFPCDDIFIPDHINIMLENDTGEVCLPIPVFDIGDYTLLLDGAPYTGQLSGCDVDSVYTYFYSQVFGQGNSGPYNIEWTLNGVVQTATVNDMVALVNLMNGLDPAGNWILDPVMLTISSSNDAGNYGLLQISHPSGSVAGLTPNFNGIPNGTQVVFAGTGNHEVVLIENFTNCDDTLFINGILQMDTIQVTTIEDTPSAQVCIDISGLPANFVEMTVCGQPANGSLLLDNECFIYFPLSGFTGNDQACLHICDEEGNCEVWIVLISVEPMCSQFNFFPNTVVEVAAPDCAAQATFCLPVELDSINNFGVLDNGVTYTGFSVCNGTLTQVALDTGFHELMVVHLATQCADTLLLNVTCTPDNDCGIEPLSGLNLLAADCDSLTEFCVNVAPMDLPNFMVLDNGTPTSLTGPCSSNDQFTGVALNTGFHQIIFADTVKGCADTFLVNVDCIMVEDSTIQITIMEGDSTLVCLGDYGYPLPAIDSLVNICENQSDGNATIQINPDTWCTTVFGEIIGQDTFCLKAYFGDTCAVLTVEVDVVSHCPDFFPGDQLIAATACSADSASVCLPLGPADIANMVVTLNAQVVADAFQPCAFDSLLLFPYSNLPSAGIIGPYEVTDWTVNGESFSGTFNSAAELAALMTLWDNSANWMAGTDSNANTIISGGNFNTDYGTMTVRQTISGAMVMLDIQLQLTPVQYGLLLPMGTSQVIFTDTLNSCPETVVADILCVQTDTLLFDVQVDSSNIYCLDLSELPGNLLSVENNCPGLGGTDVGFEIAGDCVVYTGLDPGADTACIVACDEFGICDTTILIVTAVLNPVDTVLIAMDDQVTTGEEQVILINVLQNDLFTTLTDFNIIDPPAHGQAAFLPNGDINYLPDEGYCDDETPDSFTYEICNASGCDTATVFISILCDNLEIFNGFSPNDDGKNDFFRIKGLQNYPGHHLFIYNRWGNLVYEATNYQSDWNGTWDGKDLPDGTYFYVLDLANGEKPLNGYVQLRR